MTYIVQRKDRFYVVAYDGLDPLTGRERRRWHPAGSHREAAERIAERLDLGRSPTCRRGTSTRLGGFLSNTWLPRKRAHVRATTAYRYDWMVENYVVPRLGDVALDALRAEHLDDLYAHLLLRGGHTGQPLAAKTVHEAHLIIRNGLDLAVHRGLIDRNVALAVHSPRRRGGGTVVARIWSAAELALFLESAGGQRLYPVLHLAVHTGMRRGEIAALRWSDLDRDARRVSISRTLQSLAGTPVESGAKTRTSRRCVDLDKATLAVLDNWRLRLQRDALPHQPDDWMFCNAKGRFLNPESISQLFGRIIDRSGLPRIRFHDLRVRHEAPCIRAG